MLRIVVFLNEGDPAWNANRRNVVEIRIFESLIRIDDVVPVIKRVSDPGLVALNGTGNVE